MARQATSALPPEEALTTDISFCRFFPPSVSHKKGADKAKASAKKPARR
jgi:hypothetical protein